MLHTNLSHVMIQKGYYILVHSEFVMDKMVTNDRMARERNRNENSGIK